MDISNGSNTTDVEVRTHASNENNRSRPTKEVETLTRAHSLYLIELMAPHTLDDSGEPPQNMHELQRRIQKGRAGGKKFWEEEICPRMAEHFEGHIFPYKRLERKWQTLCDGYRKALDNQNRTGQGPTRFQFFNEMSELMKARHDIHFRITGSQNGIVEHEVENEDTAGAVHPQNDDISAGAHHPTGGDNATPPAARPKTKCRRKRKRSEGTESLISY